MYTLGGRVKSDKCTEWFYVEMNDVLIGGNIRCMGR